MISCLVVHDHPDSAQTLAADLSSVGIHVIGAVQRGALVHEAARLAPDLIVAQETPVSDALLETLTLLSATVPRPVVLFTSDPDVDRMARALDAGVHAYEVNGYGRQRLRDVLHLAQARHAHEEKLRGALADVSHRFEERKLVDRAKGILMRARQLSEDEAFRVLRAASMHGNQRVGQVSQQVIAAAGHAEAVNRAGQLRMLSQHLVKLYALRAAGFELPGDLLAGSVGRIDTNLSQLGRSLSKPTYGDLLDAVLAPWKELKAALAAPNTVVGLATVDALAERTLLHADRLVSILEEGAATGSLHVINVSGRQRMLSQRVAKLALLSNLLGGRDAGAAQQAEVEARTAFEQAMVYLRGLPLSTPEIARSLEAAEAHWTHLKRAAEGVRAKAAQRQLFDASEALLQLFEQLTEGYERSMQLLIG